MTYGIWICSLNWACLWEKNRSIEEIILPDIIFIHIYISDLLCFLLRIAQNGGIFRLVYLSNSLFGLMILFHKMSRFDILLRNQTIMQFMASCKTHCVYTTQNEIWLCVNVEWSCPEVHQFQVEMNSLPCGSLRSYFLDDGSKVYCCRGNWSLTSLLHFSPNNMGLLSDTWNCELRIRRECRERFPRHRGLAMHHGTWMTQPFPLKSVAGKTFPAFPAHAQPAILRIW